MNLRKPLARFPLLQNLPPQIEICVNGRVTPVPLAEFQEEDAETIYNYCFRSDVANRVFYDTVPASNIVLLFALEETTCRIIEETFGADVHYTAALTHVVQDFATKAQGMGKQNGRRIFVYTHDGVVDIAVMEDARLLMLNTYNVRTLTDVDYYVFNLAHHLGVNIAETPVFVAGIPALRDPVVDELQKYAPAVYAVNPAAEFNPKCRFDPRRRSLRFNLCLAPQIAFTSERGCPPHLRAALPPSLFLHSPRKFPTPCESLPVNTKAVISKCPAASRHAQRRTLPKKTYSTCCVPTSILTKPEH